MQKKYLGLVLTTLASGIASAYTATLKADNDLTLLWGPGIVFGVIMGTWFFRTRRIHLLKIFAWAALSTIAYYLAVRTAIMLTNSEKITDFAFLSAGLLGAFILTISTIFLVKKLSAKQALIIIALGGIAGIIFGRLLGGNNEQAYLVYIAYTVWQMAVGISLGYFVDRDKQIA